MFVTVGDSGTILTSPDGTSWTKRTSGTIYNLNGVTYGNGSPSLNNKRKVKIGRNPKKNGMTRIEKCVLPSP